MLQACIGPQLQSQLQLSLMLPVAEQFGAHAAADVTAAGETLAKPGATGDTLSLSFAAASSAASMPVTAVSVTLPISSADSSAMIRSATVNGGGGQMHPLHHHRAGSVAAATGPSRSWSRHEVAQGSVTASGTA